MAFRVGNNIQTDTGEILTLEQAQALGMDISQVPELPMGGPVAPPAAQPVELPGGGFDFAGTQPGMPPMTFDTTRMSTGVQAPKYVGGGLDEFATRLQQKASNISAQGLPPLPSAPSLAEVRTQAEGEGGNRIFTSSLAEQQSKLRSADWAREQAEERRQLDIAAQEEHLQTLREDVRSYKIDSNSIFGLTRPITKAEKEDQARLHARELEMAERRAAAGELNADDLKELKAKQAKEASEKTTISGTGVAGSLALIIGAAMQSYASGLAGRDPTAGNAMINSFIENRMALQKAELAKRQDLAQGQVNFLGEMKSRFRDERAAELATRSLMQEGVAAEIARIGSRVKDAEDQQKLDLMRQTALAEAQRIGLQADSIELEARKAKAEQIWRTNMLAEERRRRQPADVRVPGMTIGTRLPSGEVVIEKMPNEKDAELTNKARGKVADVIRKIDTLNEYVFGPDGVGYEMFSTREAKLAKSRMRDIQLDLKSDDLKNLGVLTGPDLELLEDITSKDPTGFFTTENQMLLQDLRERVLQGFMRAGRQHGYTEDELGLLQGGEQVR